MKSNLAATTTCSAIATKATGPPILHRAVADGRWYSCTCIAGDRLRQRLDGCSLSFMTKDDAVSWYASLQREPLNVRCQSSGTLGIGCVAEILASVPVKGPYQRLAEIHSLI
jgi:hypothetical protein